MSVKEKNLYFYRFHIVFMMPVNVQEASFFVSSHRIVHTSSIYKKTALLSIIRFYRSDKHQFLLFLAFCSPYCYIITTENATFTFCLNESAVLFLKFSWIKVAESDLYQKSIFLLFSTKTNRLYTYLFSLRFFVVRSCSYKSPSLLSVPCSWQYTAKIYKNTKKDALSIKKW